MQNYLKLRNATTILQILLPSLIGEGDCVVDATVGNGHDTVMLRQLVGESGAVYGFDIQETAIEAARNRLGSDAAGVYLYNQSHAEMDRVVPEPVDLVLFNLGYLPGGDKTITTRVETTLRAVASALKILKPCGILAIVIYPGHPEGERELEALQAWAKETPQTQADVLEMKFINQANHPPQILLIEKRGK